MKVANFTDTYLPHTNGVATTLYAVHHYKKEWQDELFGPLDHPDVNKVGGIPFPLFPDYELALNTGWLKNRVKDFDVIHNHTPYGMFYYGLRIGHDLKKPVVGTFHTDPAAVFGALLAIDTDAGKIATQLTWKYLIGIYNHCDKVIAVSGWLERELKKRGMKAPIEMIPNGIDVNRFSPKTDTKKFLETYKIPKDKPLVLFMGRLQYKKDPETLVRAALKCKTDATFFISGEGELKQTLIEMAKGHDNIILPGFIPKDMVPQAYAAADVFAFPSQMETQGVVFLEAMASGTPCIATDVGIARDVCKPENIIGFKDDTALAQRIDAMLSDEKAHGKLVKESRELVEKEYSMEAMMSRLGDLYERMCRK